MLEGNAISTPARRGLADAPRGAMLDIPTAGIDQEQATVGVLQNIGEMDIGVVGSDEIEAFSCIGGTVGLELVANNFAGVVLSGKEIAAHFGGKSCGVVNLEAAVGDGWEEGHRWQDGIELQVRHGGVDGMNRVLALF